MIKKGIICILLLGFLTVTAWSQSETIPPEANGQLVISFINKKDGAIALGIQWNGNQRRIDTSFRQETFQDIYQTIYESEAERWPSDRDLKQGGELLYSSVDPLINEAQSILFILPRDSFYYMPDLLIHQNEYLFLKLPIRFAFYQDTQPPPRYREDWNIFFASDRTADPDRAILELFRNAENPGIYRNEINGFDLRRVFSTNSFDALITSTHGERLFQARQWSRRGYYLGLCSYGPQDFMEQQPQLVFFDACEIGASQAFLECFEQNGTAVYIASPVSTEAGDSSTLLLESFFQFFTQGLTPAESLYQTKLILANRYRNNSQSTFLWRCSAYRVFCF